MLKVLPNNKSAFLLMHEGAQALASAEYNGIAIDVDFLIEQMNLLESENGQEGKIPNTKAELMKFDEVQLWEKEYKDTFNLNSDKQLSEILFTKLGHKSIIETKKGNASVNEESLEALGLPFLECLIKYRKYQKLRNTYLTGILREQVDGIIHPFFNLHTVKTYRSCIAKGTYIDTVRDVSKYPKGILIEDIKEGDLVYCYDDNCQLTIKKVLWSGKTGTKKVIRIHWSSKRKKGYLDCTPEHLIRLSNGKYIEAQKLEGDLRSKEEVVKRMPKVSVLSLSRKGDTLYYTCMDYKNNGGVLEHQFIYEKLFESLNNRIIHHIDYNHFNHTPSNLEAMFLSEHARIHSFTTFSSESRRKAIDTRIRQIKDGSFIYKKGKDSPNFLANKISKVSLLRMLARHKYNASTLPYSSEAIKQCLSYYGIDMKIIKLRKNSKGKYISPQRIKELVKQGYTFSKLCKYLDIGCYDLRKSLDLLNVSIPRIYGNQYGIYNNHTITKIEYINKVCDVYDLEIEDSHNFIANGICVHNSSDRINFQNQPVRDKIAGKIVRGCFVARPGRQLMSIDYGGIEVKCAHFYHQDKTMLQYIEDPTKDMHRDMAAEIYMIANDEVSKEARYSAKNGFVFPVFYGSYFKATAKSLWDNIDKLELKTKDGLSLKENLKRNGIYDFYDFENHVQKVEDNFWNKRFKVYKKWKDEWVAQYLKKGYFCSLSGFTYKGIMTRNECINFPVQGCAFHLLLWSMTRLIEVLEKKKFKTLVIGQVHDEILFDTVPDELDDIKDIAKRIMCDKIKKEWPWISTHLAIDIELSPVDGRWSELKSIGEFRGE